MGRFKYIPQEVTKLTEEKAMQESDIWEINVKRKEEADDIIDNTLIVYNDYKIPLNITEELAKETLDIKNKIDDLYAKLKKSSDLLEEIYVNYEIFEDHIFGKREYSHNTNRFTDNYLCLPLEYEKDGYNQPINTVASDIPLDFEMQRLDYVLSCHEYNRHYIQKQEELIKKDKAFSNVDNIRNVLNGFKKMHEPLKKTISDEEFWNKAIYLMDKKYDESESLIKNLDKLATITVSYERINNESGDKSDI